MTTCSTTPPNDLPKSPSIADIVDKARHDMRHALDSAIRNAARELVLDNMCLLHFRSEYNEELRYLRRTRKRKRCADYGFYTRILINRMRYTRLRTEYRQAVRIFVAALAVYRAAHGNAIWPPQNRRRISGTPSAGSRAPGR